MAEAFMAGRDQHQENSLQLGIIRDAAKLFVFQLFYGAGAKRLGLELTKEGCVTTTEEAKQIINKFMQAHPKLKQFLKLIKQAESIDTYIYGRKIQFSPDSYKNLNWTIQGNCADLMLKALEYLYSTSQSRVDILPHFHDELVLRCKVCSTHTTDLCPNILQVKKEIESLYPFTWPGSNQKVFELGVK